MAQSVSATPTATQASTTATPTDAATTRGSARAHIRDQLNAERENAERHRFEAEEKDEERAAAGLIFFEMIETRNVEREAVIIGVGKIERRVREYDVKCGCVVCGGIMMSLVLRMVSRGVVCAAPNGAW